MSNRMAKMQELTREGLDCIGLELYIDLDTSLDESMQEIQMAFQYHSLPSDAMSIFRNRAFNGEVFRFMDEEDFEEYLRDRYPDMDLDFAC